MFERPKRPLQDERLAAGFVVLVVVLVAFYFLCAAPASPEGNYRLQHAPTDERIVFHDGKVEVQTPGAAARTVGVYFNSEGQWFFQSSITGARLLLVPGFWGMESLDPKTKTSEEYLPRSSVYWLFLAKTRAGEMIDQMKQWF